METYNKKLNVTKLGSIFNLKVVSAILNGNQY